MKELLSIAFFLMISVTGCTTLKSIKCGNPSYDTYLNFPLDTISKNGTQKEVLISSSDYNRYFEDTKFTGGCLKGETINELFSRLRGNGVILIVRNDTVLLEKYYGVFSAGYNSNIFSISKAVTSLLCGIAVDEGLISVSDPVTKYIPELETAAPQF